MKKSAEANHVLFDLQNTVIPCYMNSMNYKYKYLTFVIKKTGNKNLKYYCRLYIL